MCYCYAIYYDGEIHGRAEQLAVNGVNKEGGGGGRKLLDDDDNKRVLKERERKRPTMLTLMDFKQSNEKKPPQNLAIRFLSVYKY